jgi:hypothetical protein
MDYCHLSNITKLKNKKQKIAHKLHKASPEHKEIA